jgi:hypothetical protein
MGLRFLNIIICVLNIIVFIIINSININNIIICVINIIVFIIINSINIRNIIICIKIIIIIIIFIIINIINKIINKFEKQLSSILKNNHKFDLNGKIKKILLLLLLSLINFFKNTIITIEEKPYIF